jgi:hypothetical protein
MIKRGQIVLRDVFNQCPPTLLEKVKVRQIFHSKKEGCDILILERWNKRIVCAKATCFCAERQDWQTRIYWN